MGHGFGRGELGMGWECSSSPGDFRTDLEREVLKLHPLHCQMVCAVLPMPKVGLLQCHQ